MDDTPSIYINASTPGFAVAHINPGGDPFDVIFDEASEPLGTRPSIICAEADSSDIHSRDTVLAVTDGQTGHVTFYRVMGAPLLDGMGLASVALQEE